MPVFTRDEIQILFIHVPKTGGMSIEHFFVKNNFEMSFHDRGGANPLLPEFKCSRQHLHAAVLQATFDLASFRYVFMTVRHPVSRLISEHRMRAALRGGDIEDFDPWLDNVLRGYPGDNSMIDNHIRPQAEFWVPRCDIFRQEDGFGDAWVTRISERIGCDFADRQVELVNRFENVADQQPTPASVRRLREFYARDFELFGYDAAYRP